MSQNYKRFLALLEKWPVDKTKQGRDLGHFLRQKLTENYSAEIVSASQSPKNIDIQLESLENLVKNIHHDKYTRKFNSTSTGLTGKQLILINLFSHMYQNNFSILGEQCRQVLSTEFLEYLNAEN